MYESTMPPACVRTSEALRDWGADRGIGVYDRPLDGSAALCVCGGGVEAVAVDPRRLGTEARRRTALAHELGHLRTGALYSAVSAPDEIRRAEYRAQLWAAQTLIPRDEVIRAMMQGDREVWQLAERFQVTEDLVTFALQVYGI